MEKRVTKIKAVSYVHVGDQLVETSQLTAEQKQQLGTWIKTSILNEVFRGEATFFPAGQRPALQVPEAAGPAEFPG